MLQNPDTFLYNTAPITSLTDPNWNIRQVYTVTKVTDAGATTLGSNLACRGQGPVERLDARR